MSGSEMMDEWYEHLARTFGENFVKVAGYFRESKAWSMSYQQHFGDLLVVPKAQTIIQYSGAFWPFHEGHLSCIRGALNVVTGPVTLFLHVDHEEYRLSKGTFSESDFKEALTRVDLPGVDVRLVFEDEMPDSCSRNFTRLYQELEALNPASVIWFLAGGDRASFALTFIDQGRCVISGRENHSAFRRHGTLACERIRFVPGHHPASSTSLREARC